MDVFKWSEKAMSMDDEAWGRHAIHGVFTQGLQPYR